MTALAAEYGVSLQTITTTRPHEADLTFAARRTKESGETASTICKTLGIGRTTLYRYLGLGD